MTFQSWRSCVVNFDEHCSWTTLVGRPLFDDTVHDHCLTTTGPLFDDHCSWSLFDDPSWTTPIWTTTAHDHCLTTPLGRPLLDDPYWTVQSKKTITWSTEVRIEKFESLKSSSLMRLQLIRRINFQIPFISDLKTCFKVRLVDPNWQN